MDRSIVVRMTSKTSILDVNIRNTKTEVPVVDHLVGSWVADSFYVGVFYYHVLFGDKIGWGQSDIAGLH